MAQKPKAEKKTLIWSQTSYGRPVQEWGAGAVSTGSISARLELWLVAAPSEQGPALSCGCSVMALVSTWVSLSGRFPGPSLKCLNFWHLVLEVSFAFEYNCSTQSYVCAGQTAVPLMKNIFVLSFLSFK